VSDPLEHTRARCRRIARALLEIRKTCHRDPGHRSDGCGYFKGKFCYLRVDCRVVKSQPLCWISIIDHYSGEVLFSEPCESTPEAARFGRASFTTRISPG